MCQHKVTKRGLMISEAKITKYQKLTDEIVQLEIDPSNRDFSWLAGQWVDFSCVIGDQEYVAGYSICSAAGSGPFELLVRRSRHPVSSWLHTDDRRGCSVLIQGGSGTCVYDPEKHGEIVCLAGGIGVTPLVSMLRTARQHDRPATFYHTVRYRDELIFVREFEEGHFVVTSEGSRLDFNKIAERHGPRCHYFICGPRPFIDESEAQLKKSGAEFIHFERWW